MRGKFVLVCVFLGVFGVTCGKTAKNIESFIEADDADGGFTCRGKRNGLYQDSKNCAGFIQCWDGRIFFQNCAPGTKFNSKTKNCDWPNNVTCPDFCDSRPDGIFADPDTCRGFIQCHYMRTFRTACPGELLFNPKVMVCDWPRNVDCSIDPDGSGEL